MAVSGLGIAATSEAAVSPASEVSEARAAAPLRLVYDHFGDLSSLRSAALDGSDVQVRQGTGVGYMLAEQSPDRQSIAISFSDPQHLGLTGSLGGPGDSSVLSGFVNKHAWTSDSSEVIASLDVSSETQQRSRLVAQPADGGAPRTLADSGNGGPYLLVIGANAEDVAYISDQQNGDPPQVGTVSLEGGDPQIQAGWVDARVGPGNGPILALREIPGAYELVRLAPGAGSTTLVHTFPNRQVFYPTWSASGNWFAIAGQSGGNGYVLLVNKAGTKVKKLNRLKGRAGAIATPSLSPDGKVLAYQSNGSGPKQEGLWLRDLTLDRSCRVVKSQQASFPTAVFTPDGRRIVVSDDESRIIGTVNITRPGGSFQRLNLGQSTYPVGFAGGTDNVADAVPCAKK